MNTGTAYDILERKAVKAPRTGKGVRYIFKKIASALSFKADSIFESKDWPHLWSK